ncbi:hypothetical protein BH23VER1_BH23VER1_24720 [soil metagenome]
MEPTPAVTPVPNAGLVTSEDGGEDYFGVVLDTEPAGVVTVSLRSDDLTEGTVSPSEITFDPSNWDAFQLVTVTGVDDQEEDGDIAYHIVVSSASSDDADYDGLPEQHVSVINDDNDGFKTPMLSVGDTVWFWTSGGKNGTKDLNTSLTVYESSSTSHSEGATVTAELYLDSNSRGTASGVTDSNGEVIFSLRNAPSGSYEILVESVAADGLPWDGVQPTTNTFEKP